MPSRFPNERTTEIPAGVYRDCYRSKHENALPLIVTHGWPGSIIEQLKIIDPLTNPTADAPARPPTLSTW
jgi:hypothetical protein